MTRQEAIAEALRRHPDCAFAVAQPGLSVWLEGTWAVDLWRNQECHDAGDPKRCTEEGFPRDGHPMLPEGA